MKIELEFKDLKEIDNLLEAITCEVYLKNNLKNIIYQLNKILLDNK